MSAATDPQKRPSPADMPPKPPAAKPKVSVGPTLAEIDKEIVDLTYLRDLGRMRGEHRPLPRSVDDLLDARLRALA